MSNDTTLFKLNKFSIKSLDLKLRKDFTCFDDLLIIPPKENNSSKITVDCIGKIILHDVDIFFNYTIGNSESIYNKKVISDILDTTNQIKRLFEKIYTHSSNDDNSKLEASFSNDVLISFLKTHYRAKMKFMKKSKYILCFITLNNIIDKLIIDNKNNYLNCFIEINKLNIEQHYEDNKVLFKPSEIKNYPSC